VGLGLIEVLVGLRAMDDHEGVEIKSLGAQGDGVGSDNGEQVFVPGALPGERWQLGEVSNQRLVRSDHRQDPICEHFSECGGCVAQHMAPSLYVQWKVDVLTTAFSHRGIDVQPEPLRSVGSGQRRRTTFSFQRTGKSFVFGYHRSASHALVDVLECPVLQDAISSQLGALRTLAGTVAVEGQVGRMVVTALDQGLDIALTMPGAKQSQAERVALSKCATDINAVLLTLNGDPIVEAKSPILTINGAQISAPTAAFLQVSPEAERWIAEVITGAIKKSKSAVDLFCGVGTFTFPLARRARVAAFDGDASAIASLVDAAKSNQGFKPITATKRDLFRDPLSPRELRAFDAAVVNPPRAGAAEQCERLSKSTVKTIVMVACNPATLARDARTLLDGGYRMTKLIPIDQFVYSAHLEAVAVFQRVAPSKR